MSTEKVTPTSMVLDLTGKFSALPLDYLHLKSLSKNAFFIAALRLELRTFQRMGNCQIKSYSFNITILIELYCFCSSLLCIYLILKSNKTKCMCFFNTEISILLQLPIEYALPLMIYVSVIFLTSFCIRGVTEMVVS